MGSPGAHFGSKLGSTKGLRVLCCKYSGKSFIYIRKRVGPRTVPRGTPDVTGALLDISPSSTTVWVRSVRKSDILRYLIRFTSA